jgi:3-deoxy-D-manno-octulosonate 8-phosphate phosphatase (KDO 8-P phosphatase)
MNYKTKLKDITTLMFDVDGVFTDGSVLLLPDGEQARKMSTRDGYAVQLAVKKGLRIVIISGGSSEAVRLRLEKLGVKDIFLKSSDKMKVFNDYVNTHNLKKGEILYMGDDIPDYLVMREVGLPVCPKDAAPEILAIADYVSHRNGGEGCVRDIVEQTLKAKGLWMDGDANEW